MIKYIKLESVQLEEERPMVYRQINPVILQKFADQNQG